MVLVIRVEDENGASTGEDVVDDHRHFERLLPDVSDASFRCLGFIDPYGDTVFNIQQTKIVRDELKRLRQRAHAEAKAVIDAIDGLTRQVQETSAHLYLKFYGD